MSGPRPRIACVYLPSFSLQVEVRAAPHLAGRAVAVVSTGERPLVIACSRAAHALGVRPAMTVTQARAIAPGPAAADGARAAATDAEGLAVIAGDAARYRGALAALAEVLMAHSVTVDIGDEEAAPLTHQALYLHVPPSARAARFAAELEVALGRQGFRGRIGVADDRFTAWAAAITARAPRPPGVPLAGPAAVDAGPRGAGPIAVVPRGCAAAFLAPLPLDLLPLGEEVRPLFRALGIKTLGEFAALPPPSVGRRLQAVGADHQALARGDGPSFLRAFVPRDPIVETMHLEHELDELEPLAFVLRPLADRACQRLRGRGAAAARIAIALRRRGAGTELTMAPSRPTLSSRTLLDLARAKLGERGGRALEQPIDTVELRVVEEGAIEVETLDLFDDAATRAAGGLDRSGGIDVAIARLEAVFGEASSGAAELTDSHRPEQSFRLTPFVAPERRGARRSGTRRLAGRTPAARRHAGGRTRAVAARPAVPLAASGMAGAMRLLDPPAPQPGAPARLEVEGDEVAVVASHGPTRIEAEWWTDDPVARDYYEVETADGGRYWLFRRRSDGQFYLHGIFD